MLHNYFHLYNTAIKSTIKDKNLNTTGLTNQYFKPKTNLTGQVLPTNILDSMTQTQNGNIQCSKVTSNTSANFSMNYSTCAVVLYILFTWNPEVSKLKICSLIGNPGRILQRSLQDPVTESWYSPVQDPIGYCKNF